jgi:hypothetical protein
MNWDLKDFPFFGKVLIQQFRFSEKPPRFRGGPAIPVSHICGQSI